MTSAKWFRYLEEYTEADTKVKAANSARKELRDRIKVDLGDPDLIEAFDRARKGRDLSGEYRAKQDAAYARLMEFERKPPGYQAGLALAGPDGKPLPMTAADAARIDLQGLEAGKSKWNRGDNPYTPGTEEHARWDGAWLRGQAMIASSLTDDPEKKTAALSVVPGGKADEPKPARRGRPPGTGKNQRAQAASEKGTPDQGEGGDLGDASGDPPGGDPQPQGDPQPDTGGVGEDQGGPKNETDRYGQEWPSTNGNGNEQVR